MFVAVVVLVVAVVTAPAAAFTPPSANDTSLYPCDKEAFDALKTLAGEVEVCMDAAGQGSNCPGFSGGTICACVACRAVVHDLSRAYNAIIDKGQCFVQMANEGVPEVAARLLSISCFFAPSAPSQTGYSATVCPDASALQCGSTEDVWTSLGFPRAGQAVRGRCQRAMQGACAADSMAPYQVGYGVPRIAPYCASGCDLETGVCATDSNSTELAPQAMVSVVDMLCNPNGPYASATVEAFTGSSDYDVSVRNGSGFTPLIPAIIEFEQPPVTLYGTQMADITECKDGVLCGNGFFDKCWGGWICPGGPFALGNTDPSPQGTYSPKGYSGWIDCGALMICNPQSPTAVQLMGVAVSAAALVVVGSVYCIFALVHWLRRRRANRQSVEAGEATPLLSAAAAPAHDGASGNDVAFEGLCVDVDTAMGPRRILSDATGVLRGGQVTAIMGPSGCGKTTLMNALLGRIAVSGGRVSVGGVWGASLGERRGVGYVPQEDTMIHTLTVREVLTHAALLKMPGTAGGGGRQGAVARTVSRLGLSHTLQSVVGDESSGSRGISGGERKRVSIGMEMLGLGAVAAGQAVLMADEPTTGLDATMALEVIGCLQQVARADGTTVAAVIHQPRRAIFALVDNFVLLSAGHVVYTGPDPVGYFTGLGLVRPEGVSEGDFVLDVLAGEAAVPVGTAVASAAGIGSQLRQRDSVSDVCSTDWLVEQWQAHTGGAGHTAASPAPAPASASASRGGSWWAPLLAFVGLLRRPALPSGFFRQLWAHLRRATQQHLRNPFRLFVFLVTHFACGCVLGFGFLQNKGGGLVVPPVPTQIAQFCPAAVRETCVTEPTNWFNLRLSSFFLSLALGAASIASSVWTFGDEIPVFLRESQSGASTVAYTLAKCIADIPFIALGALFFSAPYIPMLRPVSFWSEQYAIILCVEWCCYGMGYVLSIILEDHHDALVSGIAGAFGCAILSGISPKLRVVQESYSVLAAVWALSFSRWQVEASVVLETRIYQDPDGAAFSEATHRFLTEYGWHQGNYAVDLVALVGLGVGWRLLTWILLAWMASRRR